MVKSVDSSQMTKHFRHDFPFQREIEPINIDDTADVSLGSGRTF